MPHLHTPAGVALYCETLGAGAPLLFLTGSDSDLRGHPEVTPFVSQLVKAFTVLAYDPRGLGSSLGGGSQPSMTDFADDARDLLDAMRWDRAHVLGYSFGGMTAQELALRHPERVDRLVLLCTSSGGKGGASYPLHELASLPAEERRLRNIELWDSRRDAAWRAEHPDELEAAVSELARFESAVADPRRAAGIARQLEARRHHDTYDRLPTLSVPTLVVGGRYDAIAPRPNLDALVAQIPSASLALLEGGHRVLWQDPAAATTIVDFLDGEAASADR